MVVSRGCDVLTVEIEHVDIEALRKVTEKYAIPVQPSPDALKIIQVCTYLFVFVGSGVCFCRINTDRKCISNLMVCQLELH